MDIETEILAKTLYGEARGEGLNGIEAVANVILNRVKLAKQGLVKWWGNNIREVCLKPFQFSCWNGNDPNCQKLSSDLSGDPVFDVCQRVAVRAIKGLLPDRTKGATHYHTLSVNPDWEGAIVPNVQIGNHLFYTCI